MKNRRMPNGSYGGVRGRKTKVGRKLSFSSYSIESEQKCPLPLAALRCRKVLSATGHFLSTDSLAEKYFGINPYIYCAGDPVNSLDPDGEFIDTILDVYSIGVDIKDIATSIKAGDVKGALVSGATLVYDVVAAAIPGVPAVGFAKSAVKTADKAVDAAKASGKYGSYHGKGPVSRMNKSAREKEKKYNDKDAFIQEAQRIERDGGVEKANNYNKIKSPGKKYLDRLKEWMRIS